MIDTLAGHYHSETDNPISRLPAGLKLGAALAIVAGTATVPASWTAWFAGVAALLAITAALSRIPAMFLLKRLALLSPLVAGVALVNAFQLAERGAWWLVALRSLLCLCAVILAANTTPFSKRDLGFPNRCHDAATSPHHCHALSETCWR